MHNTNILIHGSDAYILVSEYAEFTASLMYFASLCSEKPRKAKRDYVKAFKGVKRSYEQLFLARKIENGTTYWADSFFEEVAEEFKEKRIEDIDLAKIHSSVQQFLGEEVLSHSANCFKDLYLQSAISSHAMDFYSEGLFNAISTPLENEDYDAAVLTSFKYLDSVIQEIIGADAYQCFGEDLINKAFSPNSGKLQINTHPNEQSGLRNWFSGANAILRNPLAHRFINLDEKSALSAITMVALMIETATKLSPKDDNEDGT